MIEIIECKDLSPLSEYREDIHSDEETAFDEQNTERYSAGGAVLHVGWHHENEQEIEKYTEVEPCEPVRTFFAKQGAHKVSNPRETGQISDDVNLQIVHARIGKMPREKRNEREKAAQDGKNQSVYRVRRLRAIYEHVHAGDVQRR